MNANAFGSVGERPGARALGPTGREPGTIPVVRVSAADVLSPATLRPPTAQTFAELEIPDTFRSAVEQALSADEKLLWLGRPSRNPEVHPRQPALMVIGGGLLALAAVVVVASIVTGGWFGLVFAGALGLIGLAFAFLPRLANPAKTCRYCYAVTNRRALLVEVSMWNRGPAVHSYQPQQLLGMERRDNAVVPGAGDLIFEYVFALPGNNLNLKTGSFLQQGATAGLSTSPQRVPRGFMCLDQVREVEDLIRSTLLLHLEHALDAPKPAAANGHAHEHAGPAVTAACACGTTIEAPAALAGKSVKCPRCSAAVTLAPGAAATTAPVICREDGPIPAVLKAKALAGLDPNEKPVWIGQPEPKIFLLRSGAYFAVGGVGILIAVIWLLGTMAPAKAPAPPVQFGKQAPAPAKPDGGSPLLPLGLLVVSLGVTSVALVRWHSAKRTCYVLTNRRALAYKESLFGTTRDSYSPLEVANMERKNSWLGKDCGDLVFRTVRVISRTQSRPSVKTVHYGFLAIAQLGSVESLVRETLIDCLANNLNGANGR